MCASEAPSGLRGQFISVYFFHSDIRVLGMRHPDPPAVESIEYTPS